MTDTPNLSQHILEQVHAIRDQLPQWAAESALLMELGVNAERTACRLIRARASA